jgi:hypothetical protein
MAMSDWDDDLDDSWGRDDYPALTTTASGLEQTRDDTDFGWGERTWTESGQSAQDEDLERFLRDRPPHHGD